MDPKREHELRQRMGELADKAEAILNDADRKHRLVTKAEQDEIERIDREVGSIRAQLTGHGLSADMSRSQGRKTPSVVVGDLNPDEDIALRAWALGKDSTPEMRAAAERAGINWMSSTLDIRSLSVGTTTAGGNAVPNTIARSFTEIEKWYGRVQNLATVINTDSGSTLPWPVMDDTANSGRILSENTAATTTTDPTVGVVNLESFKMSSDAVIVSEELLQDSSVPLGTYLGTMLGTRLGRIKNYYFTVGTGSSQPGGVAAKATIGKTASATNAVTLDEILDLRASLDVAYRQSPSFGFMAHDDVWTYIRKLKDSNNQYLWQMSVMAGEPDRLFGIPCYTNNDMSNTFGTGERLMLCGAFDRYLVRLVGGPLFRRSDDLYFREHQSVFEVSQRVDGNLVDTTAVKALVTA